LSEIVSPLASLRESDSPICAFGCRLNFIFGNAALEPWALAMSVAVPHLLVLLIPAPLSVSALAILLLSTRFRLARISLGHCGNGSQRRAHFDRPMSEAVPHLQEGCLSSCSCTLPGGNQLYIPVLSLKTSQTVVQHESPCCGPRDWCGVVGQKAALSYM